MNMMSLPGLMIDAETITAIEAIDATTTMIHAKHKAPGGGGYDFFGIGAQPGFVLRTHRVATPFDAVKAAYDEKMGVKS